MSEIQLQSQIARKYSELFNSKYGQLFHVSNERNNKLQAYKARAMGIIPGVSDFIYFNLSKGDLFLLGMEVKEPGTFHLVSHIERQLEWARILEKNGGDWRIVTTVEDAINCIKGNLSGYTIADVQKMIDNCSKKSMKF